MTEASKKPGAGRPVIERPIQNVIGLMRHLIGNDAGVNILVAEEIEAMTGRSLVPQIEGRSSEANTRQQISKRISEIAAGGKPIPHWFETAAREWCVQRIIASLSKNRIELTVGGKGIDLARAPSARVLADGLVGLALHHAEAGEDKKVEACLRKIEEISGGTNYSPSLGADAK